MLYSFFAGRFQPFHAGHRAIVRKLLSEGKNVCIAVRNTEISSSNPFSYGERRELISKLYEAEIREHRVKVILIPDISEIVYGRGVGYKISEISMPKEVENISATKIREGMKNDDKTV